VGEQEPKLRPIVWILLLFIGPIIASLSIQYYIFLMTRALVRTEALLTQLLFDHSLRLRMKDATEEPEKEEPAVSSGPVMVTGGPLINVEDVDAAAPVGGGSNGATEVGSDSGKAKENKKAAANSEAEKTSGQGLSGRINTLIAADVESIVEGVSFCLCERELT
jgi:hypothetical protein